jgi:hypothetical protein
VTQDNKADEDQERGMHIHADAAKLPDFPGPFHAFYSPMVIKSFRRSVPKLE